VHLLDGAKPLDEIESDKTIIENELARGIQSFSKSRRCSWLEQAGTCPTRASASRQLRLRFPDLRGNQRRNRRGRARSRLCRVAHHRTRTDAEIVTPPPALIELVPARCIYDRARPRRHVLLSAASGIERLASMTDFETDEGLARFERSLAKMGVEKKLRELGASKGYRAHRAVRVTLFMRLGIFRGTFDPNTQRPLIRSRIGAFARDLDKVLSFRRTSTLSR